MQNNVSVDDKLIIKDKDNKDNNNVVKVDLSKNKQVEVNNIVPSSAFVLNHE